MEPPAPKATAAKGVSAAVGAATPVALSESPSSGDTGSPLSAAGAPLANRGDQVASGYGALPLLALIVCGLIALYAAGRLVIGGPFEPLRR